MTDRELQDFIEHGETGFVEFAMMFGDGWARHAIEIAKELRARLAQPEPLPAKSKGALSHEENKQHNKKILDKFYEENAHLYTAPPQREWQGLTDEEILEEYRQSYGDDGNLTDVYFARAIEAKLKEKNT